MDNNFNQMGNQMNNQMNNPENNQMNNQMNGQMNNQMYNNQMYSQLTNMNQGVSAMFANDMKSFDLTKTLIGAGAALAAIVLATILWVFITGITGTMIYILGFAVGFAGIFVYEKITKKMDFIGLVICLVFILIATYFGIRYGYIYYIAKETGKSVSTAKVWFEWAYEMSSEVRSEYIGYMIKSYIFSVAYSVAVLIKKFKEN